MALRDLKVGDEVIATSSRGDKRVAALTKVGRKWLTVDHPSGERFDAETGRGNYWRLRTHEEHELERRAVVAQAELHAVGVFVHGLRLADAEKWIRIRESLDWLVAETNGGA